MQQTKFVLRCFAERRDSVWLAFCLDINLGVQGSSMADAKKRLDSAVRSYMEDILEGDDKEHFADLYPRRAPLSLWVRYAYLSAKLRIRQIVSGTTKKQVEFFTETLQAPMHCA